MQKDYIETLKSQRLKYKTYIKFFKSTALKLFLEPEFDSENLKKAEKDGFVIRMKD